MVGHATADVPGLPGAHFTGFDRPFGSPNGNWILSADTDLPTTTDELILVNGAVVGQEGTAAPWAPGENFGTIDQKLGINDAGEWVFATNVAPSTVNDDFIVRFSGGSFTAIAQEGQPIPALPPAIYDDSIDTAVITSAGTVGLSADGIDGGPPTTQDEILVLGSTLIAQEGVTVPTGQLGSEFWDNFDTDDFFVSADGTHWMANGDLTGSTTSDDVTVVDGAVVVQEDVILPGSGFANPVDGSGIVGIWMAANGDWFVRGNNDTTEQDWVYRNGVVIATLGTPIYTGASEVWSDVDFSDCFFFHVADSNGHYVLGGVTDGPSTANGVLVLDGTTEVVREGDFVDLNGNGLPDDDAFFNTFGNDDGVLTDAGLFYFVASIRNAAGADLGDGYFVIDLSGVIGGGGSCGEDFDGVTAPALPAGWVASTPLDCATSDPFVNSTTTPDTAPNAPFTNDPNCISDEVLVSPAITYPAGAQLTFRHSVNLEASAVTPGLAFDGAVLEISISAGPFQDILTAGGSFAVGAYSHTVSGSFSNPLANRPAWSGNSGGYITTTVNLPAAGVGLPVVLRFRRGTDSSVSALFWRVDSIVVTPCGGGPCTIVPPPDVVVGNDPGQCGAAVDYPAPGGTCAGVTCVAPSGSFFPVGTTTVTCSDPTGINETFDVTVNDVEPPALFCPADLFVTAPPGVLSWPVAYSEPTPTDNCPGVTGSCAPPSGDPFPIGTTTVVCSAVDASANSANCPFDVSVTTQAIQDIPTASSFGLAALALLLAGAAFVALRRHG